MRWSVSSCSRKHKNKVSADIKDFLWHSGLDFSLSFFSKQHSLNLAFEITFDLLLIFLLLVSIDEKQKTANSKLKYEPLNSELLIQESSLSLHPLPSHEDSPRRWRSSCWQCCKAPGPLARPCLWVWHRSSSDPASPPNCSRCPALSSGGSRPHSLRRRRNRRRVKAACATWLMQCTSEHFSVYWFIGLILAAC